MVGDWSMPTRWKRIDRECNGVVSCAVYMSGGPEFLVPLGRRDSLTFANKIVILANLPSPTSNVTVLMTAFAAKGFKNFTDLVALKGGHTFGISHYASFVGRLCLMQDATLAIFAKEIDLQNGEGLLLSDQGLYNFSRIQ